MLFSPVTAVTADDDWARLELQGLVLNDQRLEDRAVAIVHTLSAQAGQSIPAACPTPAELKATYRFFNNRKVTPTALLAPHTRRVVTRLRAVPVALLVGDISELNFTDKGVADELGLIGDNRTRGLFLNPLLALTPERLPLGLADLHTWTRPERPRAVPRKYAPLAHKETYCWLQQYRRACQLASQAPDTQLIYITDRGGDIYELYHEAQTRRQAGLPRADLLIRGSEPPRNLCAQDAAGDAQAAHLIDQCATLPVRATLQFTLPATRDRVARPVTQAARAGTVWLRAPYRQDQSVADAPINVVYLEETAPPAGTAPLVWLLCTTLPVDTEAQVQAIVEAYLARWEIELYFKVLKSGCAIEKLYLQTADRLMTCLALYLLIAWRVLYCARVGRTCPDLPCTVVYTPDEWEAIYLVSTGVRTLPPAPPTLRELTHMIARCGGFVGRPHDGEPGMQTLWIGLQRLADYTVAYQTFGPKCKRRQR